MADNRIRNALRECEVFSKVGNAELEKIADLTVERQYEAGNTLFTEGNNADTLFVLQEGKVALQTMLPALPAEVGEARRRVTSEIVDKNEVFGWSAIVEPCLYTFTAVSLQNIRVLAIDGIQLRQQTKINCEVTAKILNELVKVVAVRLKQAQQLLISERSTVYNTV